EQKHVERKAASPEICPTTNISRQGFQHVRAVPSFSRIKLSQRLRSPQMQDRHLCYAAHWQSSSSCSQAQIEVFCRSEFVSKTAECYKTGSSHQEVPGGHIGPLAVLRRIAESVPSLGHPA